MPCGRADRGLRPYGWVIDGAVCGGTHGSRPTLHYFVGQGPCALPGVRGKNPPVTASPCQPPLGKGAEGTGVTDCHDQRARWSRNDTSRELRCKPGSGRCRHRPLRKRYKRCDGRATARVAPTEGFSIGFSKVYPIPFLHISCSLCVDSLWINFPSPFLPPSCGNSSFPLWTKNLCISRPYGGFPQKFSLRLLLLKNT